MKWKLVTRIMNPKGAEEAPHELYESEEVALSKIQEWVRLGFVSLYVADEPYKSERLPFTYHLPIHRIVAWEIYEVAV